MNRFEREVPDGRFDPKLCLSSGQVFRWKPETQGVWRGVDGEHHYSLSVRSSPDGVTVAVETNATEEQFSSLFRLDTDLEEVESEILAEAPELAPSVRGLHGLRLMRPSDPQEALACFLCTVNNNLARITKMANCLAEYGDPIGGAAERWARRFPLLERIARIPEEELRQLGFGYRARTIPSIAAQVGERGDGWLDDLKRRPYEQAVDELLTLKGVGRKLADCIALFALHHTEAVPIDTHLWQASVNLYFPEWRGRSLTNSRYLKLGGWFRDRFGKRAGWAHQYLYYAHLLGIEHAP